MVATFVLDKNLRCDFINAVAEVLVGLSLSQAKGRHFSSLLWPGQEETAPASNLRRLLDSGVGGEGEEAIWDYHGRQRPFSYRVAPLGTSDDQRGYVVELVDLSGETGTSRALRESERRLRLAVEATGMGIWDVNAKTGERRWSPEFNAILGLPDDVEPNTELFYSLIHPADRDRVAALYEDAYAPGGSGEYGAEFRIIRANDGVERWVSTTGRITFDPRGNAVRGIGVLRDIHPRRQSEEALRESEERLRIALVAGRMGTWRFDLQTGTQQWDDMQYQILGLERTEKPSRELFLSLVHPDDVDKIEFDIETLPIGTFLNSEFRIITPRGELRWISAHSVVRVDAKGEPIEMIGVNRDTTASKRAEAATRISEERHRLAIEATDLGTWDFDMIAGRHLWSPQYKRLWGLAPDAPSDPDLLRPLVDEEHWQTVARPWQESSDPEQGGRIAVEFPIHRAGDGARRWCALIGQVLYDDKRTTPLRAIGILMDTTDRREAEERQRMVVREMNHRVKNTLAVVQAIVSQTFRMSRPSEAFPRIQARLMAIARTHDFLNLTDWSSVALTDLLKSELDPYASHDDQRVRLEGPSILLELENSAVTGADLS